MVAIAISMVKDNLYIPVVAYSATKVDLVAVMSLIILSAAVDNT